MNSQNVCLLDIGTSIDPLTLSEYCYLIAMLTPDERQTLLEIAVDWEEMTAEGYEPQDIAVYIRRTYPIGT